ncbi:hypothetical protein L596_023242 [Steinernema carpocapsae]|uniref:Fatty-acid and retinol-binding protein 1 n=1 Tax=Steinernema carpocapsae TaxID=34508 RepID=A0A4U5MD16_STECR|nr:hypothetical protein L596_023242 [Steinernema carpocapsae]
MHKAVAALAFFCFSASSLPIPNDADAQKFLEYLPDEVVSFVKSLTPEELKTLEEIRPKIAERLKANKYLTEEDSLLLVKERSSSLYDKIRAMYEKLMERLNKLSTGPKEFVTYAMKTINKFSYENDEEKIVAKTLELLEEGEHLSGDSKKEIFQAFPSVQKFFEDRKIKKFLERTRGKQAPVVLKMLRSLK